VPRQGALEWPVLVRGSRLAHAASVPTMTECEFTKFAWGQVCPSCGTQTVRSDSRSWMARRHAGSDDHRRVVGATHFYRKHRNAGIYAKRGRAA
jgi:hypothetical protein